MKNKITLTQNTESINLKQAFIKFVSVKTTINLSDKSIDNYTSVFKYFTDFFGEESFCSDVTEDTIYDFIKSIRHNNKDISPVSVNTYLRNLRAVFYFFMEKGYMTSFKIKLLKCEKQLKETYTEDELVKLLKKPDIKESSFPEYRNWVLINYLLGTGNRVSTVCNLKIQDIDFANDDIVLRRVKNNKQYTIPLSATLKKVLLEYLQYRKGKPEDFLFCNQFGEQFCQEAMKTAIQRYNHARGVTKTSIHLFRHTFAKNWILGGGDIFRLQKILGHSSIEIVKEYVQMFGGDLKHDFDRFNPLDNINGSVRDKRLIKMNDK